jgi:hypothetical protein
VHQIEWAPRWLLFGVSLLATGAEGARDEPRMDTPLFDVRVQDGATRSTVRAALAGAYRRLAEGRCQGVFADFTDGAGRSLMEGLATRGGTPQSHLTTIIFYDGHAHPRCHVRGTLAFTQTGGRIVLVCPEEFRSTWRRDPFLGEAILIHEELHTLGLGENPPSSREITAKVLKNCRH